VQQQHDAVDARQSPIIAVVVVVVVVVVVIVAVEVLY